jgi:hypothetical protein
VLGAALEDHRKENGWAEGVAIWIAVLVVDLVSSVNDYQKDQQFRVLNAAKEVFDVTVVRDGHQVCAPPRSSACADVVGRHQFYVWYLAAKIGCLGATRIGQCVCVGLHVGGLGTRCSVSTIGRGLLSTLAQISTYGVGSVSRQHGSIFPCHAHHATVFPGCCAVLRAGAMLTGGLPGASAHEQGSA